MTAIQKVIKYLAILLAIFITANIISAILFGIYILSTCAGLIKSQDNLENYTLKIEKGLGSININGDLVSDDKQIGSGANYLEIEGGIGSINIINL